MITTMNDQMLAAARELQFEVAARLRDELNELKRELRQLDAAHCPRVHGLHATQDVGRRREGVAGR